MAIGENRPRKLHRIQIEQDGQNQYWPYPLNSQHTGEVNRVVWVRKQAGGKKISLSTTVVRDLLDLFGLVYYAQW